jgi:hypothetical protein
MHSYHFVNHLIHFAGLPPGQDVMGNIGHFWKDLTSTGKLSAGIVGFVLGFLLRGITR